MGALRFGRYEAIRTIASGGMATVHLARAVGEGGFERLVAIKVMHAHIAADPDFRAMFMDEARLAARIRHPNVVGVLDTQNSGESMFLVMEYVDGPSLHQLRKVLRKKQTTLPIGMTLRIFVDVLSGLHDAHELVGADGLPLQLIHRDVSPQNILVGRDGVSRITDFGVARSEARITSTRGGQLKGKIAYMPPEQLKNEKLDRRADVYSAGCALWEALAGRRLFRADSEAAMLHMILDGVRAPPSMLNPQVPPDVDEVCMRALSMAPSARQATAADLADELEDAARRAGGEVATTRQVSTFIKTLPELATETIHVPSSPSARTSMPDRERMAEASWPGIRPDSGATHGALVAVPAVSTRRARWPVMVGAAVLASGVAAYLLFAGGEAERVTTVSPPAAESTRVSEPPVPSTQVPSAQAPSAQVSSAEVPSAQVPRAEVPRAEASPTPSAAPKAQEQPAPRRQKKPKPQTGPGYIPPEL